MKMHGFSKITKSPFREMFIIIIIIIHFYSLLWFHTMYESEPDHMFYSVTSIVEHILLM